MKLPDKKYAVKRRRVLFKNIFRNYFVWLSLIETIGPDCSVQRVDGEDVNFYDLMEGYNDLPPRQKEAFDLHVLGGMSEGQAAKIMFPGSRWSTPVQQYSKSALIRMIAAYDKLQTEEGRRERRRENIKSWQEKMQQRAEEARHWLEEEERRRERAKGVEHSQRPLEDRPESLESARRQLLGLDE